MNTGSGLRSKNSVDLPQTVEAINSAAAIVDKITRIANSGNLAVMSPLASSLLLSANQESLGVANRLGVFFLQQLQMLCRCDGILGRILDVFISVFAAVEKVTHDGPLD